ncbi:PREDICTED: uncharacterized protein LOC102846900 [Elephantulus edwardii]|uniref:uncharacterized protein LOC102846900 n=1 Tax=Elephantulus edwardii TaxID=28737 RepID=UPI0003F09F20|nr:PREDICTED: uncharacterized protein LOC102846900 [Elephantulus edwardii]
MGSRAGEQTLARGARTGETAAHAQVRLPHRRQTAWKVPEGSRTLGSPGGGAVCLPLAISRRAHGAIISQQPLGRGSQRGSAERRTRSCGGGAARRLYEGGGAAVAVARAGGVAAVCAAASAFKPRLARPQRAFAVREPLSRLFSPLRPGSRLGPEPRAVHSGMPRYELALILKAMQRPETAAALKRMIEALMDRGAIVRNLENLGERPLPYRMAAHNQKHTRGGYFLVDFYAPTTRVENIMEYLSRDVDVIRPTVVKHPLTQEVKECEGIVPVPLEEKLYFVKKKK